MRFNTRCRFTHRGGARRLISGCGSGGGGGGGGSAAAAEDGRRATQVGSRCRITVEPATERVAADSASEAAVRLFKGSHHQRTEPRKA